MKVALVKIGALGDVVRTTSVVAGVRRRWADANITWITSHAALPLIAGLPAVRAAAIDDPEDTAWRSTHYDWIINLDDEFVSCATATQLRGDRLSGAYVDRDGRRTYTRDLASWFDMGILQSDRPNGLATANQLKRENTRSYGELLYEGLDLPLPVARPTVIVPDASRRKAAEWLAAHRIAHRGPMIGVNSAAGERWQRKTWGVGPTSELALRLARQGWTVLVLGGPAERDRNRAISARASHDRVIAGPSDFDLLSFAALVGACAALVCSDTLAMHLAIAAQVPVVALFGPTSDAEIDLFGLGEKIVAPVPCARCYRTTCEVMPDCMQLITPEMVLARVQVRGAPR
jgi:heptosyltransferase-2